MLRGAKVELLLKTGALYLNSLFKNGGVLCLTLFAVFILCLYFILAVLILCLGSGILCLVPKIILALLTVSTVHLLFKRSGCYH